MFGHYDLIVAHLRADRLHRRDRRPEAISSRCPSASGRPTRWPAPACADRRRGQHAATSIMRRRTLLRALAAWSAALAARARGAAAAGASGDAAGATCSTRRRCSSPLAARGLINGAGPRRRAPGRRRPARPRAVSRRRRQAAGGRPRCRSAPTWWRCISRRRAGLGRRPRRRGAAQRRRRRAPGRASSTAAASATLLVDATAQPRSRRRQVARRGASASPAQGAENPFLDVWFDDAASRLSSSAPSA